MHSFSKLNTSSVYISFSRLCSMTTFSCKGSGKCGLYFTVENQKFFYYRKGGEWILGGKQFSSIRYYYWCQIKKTIKIQIRRDFIQKDYYKKDKRDYCNRGMGISAIWGFLHLKSQVGKSFSLTGRSQQKLEKTGCGEVG